MPVPLPLAVWLCPETCSTVDDRHGQRSIIIESMYDWKFELNRFPVVPSRTQSLCNFLFSGKLAQNTYCRQCPNCGSTHLSVRSENWTGFLGQTPDGATPRTQTDRTQPKRAHRGSSLASQLHRAIFFNFLTMARSPQWKTCAKFGASSPHNYTHVVTLVTSLEHLHALKWC
jgi:hypothetical protein